MVYARTVEMQSYQDERRLWVHDIKDERIYTKGVNSSNRENTLLLNE